jgi:hypothetical protein
MTRRLSMPRLSYYYPFTIAGSLLFIVSVVLIGTGLAQRNPYALFLGLLSLAVLGVLAVAGRLQAGRAAGFPVQWDSSTTLIARRSDLAQSLHGEPAPLLPFFRHHFRLSGTLNVGRGASLTIVREVAFASGTGRSSSAAAHPIPLHLPLCGSLTCRGRFMIRDLFGLTRARYGDDPARGFDERMLMVQPASWSPKGIPPIEPSVGLEEKSRRRTSDEERYYMREYMPGDRFRDINWKVSSRLNELITRISPLTQERTTVLEIAFRNFREPAPESVESLAHLNVLKSWLVSFLRRMKTDHPEVQFRVQTAAAVEMLASDEEIERFAWELASEFFASESSVPAIEAAPGELFVFSTPFDRRLSRFLAAQTHTRVHLFRTAFPRNGARNSARKSAGSGEEPLRLLTDPLEDLPGRWILHREPRGASAIAASPGPRNGSLIEETFAVRVY